MEKDKYYKYLYYKGISQKQLAELYNQSGVGFIGFEKILNIHSSLNVMKQELEEQIGSELKKVIRKYLKEDMNEERGNKINEHYSRVKALLNSYPFDDDVGVYDWSREFLPQAIDILSTKVSGFGEPHSTYADELAAVLGFAEVDREVTLLIKLVRDVSNIESFVKMIIVKGYPNYLEIDDEDERRKREERKKKLDKIPNRHKHRAPDIKEKYRELRVEFPESSDSEIRGDVMDWYMQTYDKPIDESTIRDYLNER